MRIQFIPFFMISLFLGNRAATQPVIGVWKGTSICQVKNSPCHDETDIYHISKGSAADQYRVDANKIVDGKEVEMGTLFFTYDSKKNILVCPDSERDSRWEFKLTGKEMHGTLIVKDKLYRLIELKKED